jgi:hypothetical protein
LRVRGWGASPGASYQRWSLTDVPPSGRDFFTLIALIARPFPPPVIFDR